MKYVFCLSVVSRKLRTLAWSNCIALTLAAVCSAQNTYFDTNGATAGIGGGGGTTGNWASGAGGAYWTADPNGISPAPGTTSWASSTDKTAVFDATNGLSAATVPMTGGTNVFVSGLIFKVGGYTISPAVSGAGMTLQKAHTIEVDAGTATISAVVAGSAGYSVTGGGTLSLTNTGNTITGPVNVSGGSTLAIATNAPIGGTGAGSGDVTLNNATLRNDNTSSGISFLTSNRGIILAGSGGHVSANGGSGIVSIYAGLISGTGPLSVDGTGTFRLTTTTATYSGATIVNGKLQISTTANVLPSGTDMTINSGGVFDVQANQTISSLAGSGNLTSASSPTLTLGGATNTSYSGVISGNATITKSGGSTMIISNDWTNTGATNINSGTLQYSTSSAGLSTGSAVAINNGGTLDMNSISDTFGSLNSTAGQTTGVLAMGSGNTLHLGQTATTGRSYDGKITGSGTLDKAGSTFTQTLNGDNSGFAGPITVTLGKIAVGNVNALGTTASNTSVASGAELLFDGAANSFTIAEPISIAGAGADGGAITVQNSSVTNLAGPITLTADATVTTSSSATSTYSNANAFTGNNLNLTVQGGSGAGGGTTISGIIALGTGSLTKLQGGKVTLSAANTHSGGTKIVDGALALGDKAALGTGTLSLGDTVTAPITGVSLSSTTDLSNANAVANAITVNRDFSITGSNKLELSGNMNLGAVNRTVTVTNSADTIISGVIGDGGFGTGALSKAGSGKLILTNGSNSYGGGTIVSAGTLLVNNTTGSATGSGNIGVTGGVFGGTGAVSGSVSISGTGTLSPGASVESLATGALSFFAGSTLKYEIDSSAPLAAAADLLDANGGLSIAAGSLLTLSDVANTPVTVPVGTRFTMISYSGTWDNGTFNGAADDSVITLGGDYYVINYNDENAGVNFSGGSFSNFVTLTAVPEVNGSLLGGLVMLIVGFVIGGRKLINKTPAA